MLSILFIIKYYIFRFYNYLLGSIEVSIATMKKCYRNSVDECYVTSFIPKHNLPTRQPNFMDPFMEPLVAELEKLFVEGRKFKRYYYLTLLTYLSFQVQFLLQTKSLKFSSSIFTAFSHLKLI